jgi:hypothetical protein
MVTATAEYSRAREERNGVKFGVETLTIFPYLFGETIEFYGYNELMGFRVPYIQHFSEFLCSFTYEGQEYHYVSPPILKEMITKGFLSSSKYAILNEDAMDEEFKKQIEKIKETIRNDTRTDNNREQPQQLE